MTDPRNLRERYRECADELEQRAAQSTVRSALFQTIHTEERVGRYVLRRRIGAGGMGIVFAAHDPDLDRDVAIKLLRWRDDRDTAMSPLLHEARAIARLSHPNIVTIHDIGAHRGRAFIAMELVLGRSLREWLAEHRPWRETAAVLAHAARGVTAAHEHGIVHRDFKPANVLIGDDGRVCVADFGLAHRVEAQPQAPLVANLSPAHARLITRSGDIVGTPQYMAPEQYLGIEQDARTDQFALCVTLYEALFGVRPFVGNTLGEMRDAILHQPVVFPPTDASIPRKLLDAVARGLSKQRRDRFPTLAPLTALLHDVAGDVSIRRLTTAPARGDEQPGAAWFARYLAGLPVGLHSYPEHRISARMVLSALAQRPLDPIPAKLEPFIARLGSDAMVPAVVARATMAAIFDQHFTTLAQWRAFIANVHRTAVAMMFANFSLQPPSSPLFIQSICALFNQHVDGFALSIERTGGGVAVLAMPHPGGAMNDLSRLGVAEALRAGMILAGCSVVHARVIDEDPARFALEMKWR